MAEKYLILCNRHEGIFGDNFALWWGFKNEGGGYSSDFRNAHLYNYDEIKEHHLNDKDDPAIKLSDLGYTEESFSALPQDNNLVVLIEKGILNDLLNLNLRNRGK
jgi:hypothetical protein